MKEFVVVPLKPTLVLGKPQKNTAEDEVREPFVPHVVYDALKGKKRFDSMRVGV
jgi:hypothetical protein